ncbi:MAG: hypothetical protein ACREX9_06845 [Gammaproteobacteria bacterium]
MEHLLERVPDNADAWFERGGTNYQKGDLQAALADATRACDLGKSEACGWVEKLKDPGQDH